MKEYGKKGLGLHARVRCPFVLVVSQYASEIDRIAGLVGGIGTATVIAYGKVEDVAVNPPQGSAVLAVLGSLDDLLATTGVMRWLRRRWPSCARAMIDDVGDCESEIAARSEGATYFIRPVGDAEWSAMLETAVKWTAQAVGREVEKIQPS